ncbi:MAG: hypothetical protein K5896_01205 [Prevotella sp.]|nr:hypothetical protein [Prevotella sp.]
MRTSPHIGNSHLEQMNLIYEFICRFDVDNLLYAINGKQLDEEEIVSLTNDIREYNVKLGRQKQYLFKYCKTFPKEFAHEDNNLVDSSVKVSWRMRSGSAGVKKIFKKFCKVSYKQPPKGMSEQQAIDRSLISSKNYMLELFGLSSYPQCVKELFVAMFDFYTNMSECLEEGMRALKEEKITKGDARKCLEVLIKSCEKSRVAQAHLIEAMMADPDLKKAVMESKELSGDNENPVLKAYKNSATSKEQFAQHYYHNCSPKDVGKITIYEAYSEADEDPALNFAKVVFGKDVEKIRRINFVIEHFDKLLPEKCKRGQIPALNLYFFYEWSQPIVGIESFLKYFNKYYKEHGGKWETIGKSAITGARTKDTTCKDDSLKKMRNKMLSQIESMLSEKFPKMEIAS